MHQEHKNTIRQNRHDKQKTSFCRLLQRPAWKQSRPILEGK